MLMDANFGSWSPDVADLNNPGVTNAFNVKPTFGPEQGAVMYMPLKSASLYSDTTMASRPLGSAIGKDKLSTARVYAGCATELYRLDPSTRGWQNISRSDGYLTADGERWETTEYGNATFFTNYSNEIQFINRDVDTQFANATTLVKGRHIATVREMIVVGNTFDALDGVVPFRVRWSGNENPLSWDFSPSTGADFQDIYGYGAVQGIVGGDVGWILLEKGIFRMGFVEAPYWFRFDHVPNSKGCAVPQSVVTVEGSTYFIASDGFWRMDGNTGQTTPVGAGKVDNYFLNDADPNMYSHMTVAADPREKLIYWSYMSNDAQDGVPDKMLIFNYLTGDWAPAEATVDFIFNSLSLPYTIEQLDAFGSIEQVPASFDSPIWAGGAALFWGMKSDGSIWLFGGDTLPALIETQELLLINNLRRMDPRTQGDRTRVTGVRPLYEVGGNAQISVRVGSRGLPSDDLVWSDYKSTHPQTGFAYFRQQNRFHRVGIRLEGNWTRAMAYQIDASSAGIR